MLASPEQPVEELLSNDDISRAQAQIYSYLEKGQSAYKHAAAVYEMFGPDEAAGEYEEATRAFAGAGAEETILQDNGVDIPADPVRYLIMSDCLAKRAQATETDPYSGATYGPGEKNETIKVPDTDEDGNDIQRALTHHQYLTWLSGEYAVRASAAFLGEDPARISAIAGELTDIDPVEVIPEAAEEAVRDVNLPTGTYALPKINDSENTQEPSRHVKVEAIDQIRRWIRFTAAQPKGAKAIGRFSEILLEDITQESPALGGDLVSSNF